MNTQNLTQTDRDLIEKAKKCTEWYDASRMEDRAESNEAKEILHNITMRLYRADEWLAGTL